MTDREDRIAQIRQGWESFWRAEAPEARWADPPDRCSFVPFDGLDILEGRERIGDWLRRRRQGQRLVEAQWRELSGWREGDTLVWCAELRFTLAPTCNAPWPPAKGSHDAAAEGAPERRSLRLLAAVQGSGADLRFRHLAEAAPAALVEMIGDYHAHAASGSSR